MVEFIYGAADIEAVTDGAVNLKTLNNWANNDEWFSPLAPAPRGTARKFSRVNLIEAGLASFLQMGGASRREAKEIIGLLASKGTSGYADDRPERLEKRIPYRRGSAGWYLVVTRQIQKGTAVLDDVVERQEADLASTLAAIEYPAIVAPLSLLIQRIDAIEPSRRGDV